jgi:uncharacterized protein (TIGR02246 family)
MLTTGLSGQFIQAQTKQQEPATKKPAVGVPAIPTKPAVAIPAVAAAPGDSRQADRDAIRQVFDNFAKSFTERDAKSLTAHFTSDAHFQNQDGLDLHGQAEIEKAFTSFFSGTPEVSARVKSNVIKFLSKDLALDEGLAVVQRGPVEVAAEARYTATLVREDGTWKIAQYVESAGDQEVDVKDIAWLIGQWKSTPSEGSVIATKYVWEPGSKFIHVQFVRKDKDLELSGHQIIGVDPATGGIRSWTFESKGGISEANWTRDGDHWVLDAEGTLVDGRTLTETVILRRVSEDAVTWQYINRQLDGEYLEDLPPVKATRVK